eukprot:Gregarina_sp_Poly_1__1991@NODE_1521_length_3935_cov_50_029214_g642_i1_p2_GENE_NODE_1521_length_3935_cov_50_029214_g642_i1NODE_1521_length_3935_cov_50_029214_g642_i1_p2_ORF_typecomplete_len114_score21_83_NODE_1521_length_3935_cov_50_029214_g642_i1114455
MQSMSPSELLPPLPPAVAFMGTTDTALTSDVEDIETEDDQQSPRSTKFESMADSPAHSFGTSAMRELLDLQRQKSTILKRLNLLHENLVVPSQVGHHHDSSDYVRIPGYFWCL